MTFAALLFAYLPALLIQMTAGWRSYLVLTAIGCASLAGSIYILSTAICSISGCPESFIVSPLALVGLAVSAGCILKKAEEVWTDIQFRKGKTR